MLGYSLSSNDPYTGCVPSSSGVVRCKGSVMEAKRLANDGTYALTMCVLARANQRGVNATRWSEPLRELCQYRTKGF